MLLVKVGNRRHALGNIVFVLGFDMFPKTAILAVFTQNEVQKHHVRTLEDCRIAPSISLVKATGVKTLPSKEHSPNVAA